MDLYEHEAKGIFSRQGIPIPQGRVVSNAAEASKFAAEIGRPVAIKAQILTGGRGRAGGVRFADDPRRAEEIAGELLSSKIKGLKVEKLLVEEKLEILEELYVGVTIDRSAGRSVVMASREGGMEIEQVPRGRIFSRLVDPFIGFHPHMARELVGKLGLERGFKEVSEILFLLYQIFKERDATIAEINPLAMTKQGAFAADAKLSIDDDALLRQGFAREKENYVELQGSIGCIVNGAGLAMSTMDTLKYLGGEPANFLDIGGGAAKDAVKEAVEKIATHPNLKLIFVNILGGITKCDDIARGIVESRDMIKVPVVIRLRGTNEEEARALLESEGFEMVASMTKAARKAVEIAT